MALTDFNLTVIRMKFQRRWRQGFRVMAGVSEPGLLVGPSMNLVFVADGGTGEAALWQSESDGHLGRRKWVGTGFQGLARAVFYSDASAHHGIFYFPVARALVRGRVDEDGMLETQLERAPASATWTTLATVVSDGRPWLLRYDSTTGQARTTDLSDAAPLIDQLGMGSSRQAWGRDWQHLCALSLGPVNGAERTVLVLVDREGRCELWELDPATLDRQTLLSTTSLGSGITQVLPCPQTGAATVAVLYGGAGLARVYLVNAYTGQLQHSTDTSLGLSFTTAFMVSTQTAPPVPYLHVVDALSGDAAIHPVGVGGRVSPDRVDAREPEALSDAGLDRLLGPGSLTAEGLQAYWSQISRGRFSFDGLEIVPGFFTCEEPWEEVKTWSPLDQIQATIDAARAAGVSIPSGRSVLAIHTWGRGVNTRGGHVLANFRDRSPNYLAHEIGHLFGLPHAFSDDPTPLDALFPPADDGWPPVGGYDDHWDVMGGSQFCDVNAEGLLIGPTLSVDAMDKLGWIDERDVIVVPEGLPSAEPYLVKSKSLVKVVPPIALRVPLGEKAWWSIEVQSQAGWDRGLTQSLAFIRHFHTFQDSRDETVRTHKLLRTRIDDDPDRAPRQYAYDATHQAAVSVYDLGAKDHVARVYAARGDSNAQLHRFDGASRVAGETWRGLWTSGWTCARALVASGRPALFLLKEQGYGSDGANIHIEAMDNDGRWAGRIGQARVDEGFSHAVLSDLGGALSLLLYSTRSGRVEVRALRADLHIEAPSWQSQWTPGWTSLSSASPGPERALLLHKTRGLSASGQELQVHVLGSDGVPGERRFFEVQGEGAQVAVLGAAEGPLVLRVQVDTGEATVRLMHPDLHLGPAIGTFRLEAGTVDLRGHRHLGGALFTQLTADGRLVTWRLSTNRQSVDQLSDHTLGGRWAQVCPVREGPFGRLFLGAP